MVSEARANPPFPASDGGGGNDPASVATSDVGLAFLILSQPNITFTL
jgi:hypothetical protein